MKNSQKGFIVPLLLVIIAVLVVGGGVYVYKNKKVEVPVVDNGTQEPNNPPPQTDTSFKILSPKTGDSWKIGGTYFAKFQNLPKGSFVQGWLQNKNEVNTGTASIGVVETGRDGNPSSNIQITIPSQWCGGECGAVEYVAPGQYRLLLRIYPSSNNSSYQTFYSDYFTVTSTVTTNEPKGGGTAVKEKIVGDYQWENTTLQSQYSSLLWNKITTNKLAGFSPKTSLTEKKTEGCEGRGDGSYLRTEGGLCGVGYWLEDSSGTRIDSKEKLAARFAPVESEAEGVSFIVVEQSGLKIDTSGVPAGHTLTISDGFLVQLVYTNTFGCGGHEPTGVIFKISKNGEVLRIASEKQKPPKPGEPVLCVD